MMSRNRVYNFNGELYENDQKIITTLEVGQVTSGPTASASITVDPTTHVHTLDLTLQPGETGPTGPKGPTGT